MNSAQDFESYPLRQELDAEIIMHREAHFGGNFTVMLEYYRSQGKGVRPEFDIERIQALAENESFSKQNLAPQLLSGAEAEAVARAKQAYKQLRDLYDKEDLPSNIPLLISDLILSEEEYPKAEIDAIVKEQSAIVPSLLELLRAEDYYNPLFPGYGQAPMLAAKCLGLIGDKRAIIALFEAIGEEDFFNEDTLLEALKAIGSPAKEFLLKVVKARPLNIDNEKAAIALIPFRDDPDVAESCLKLLLDPEIRKDFTLSTYLVLACEGLKGEEQRKTLTALASNPQTSRSLAKDIQAVSKSWK